VRSPSFFVGSPTPTVARATKKEREGPAPEAVGPRGRAGSLHYGRRVEVIAAGDPCPPRAEGAAVTVGFFDGVHLGHRAVIATARRLATARGATTAAVTFDRHPATVVRPESAPLLLTDLDQRLERLAEAGVEVTLVVPFDEVRAKEPAEEFVTEILVGCLAARAVVVGADFHFGHRRRGDVALLRAMGAEHGFEVHGVDLAGAGAGPPGTVPAISSTAIRRALAAGDVAAANRMLGRPHEVRGVVERGDQRGAALGYPTANVAVPPSIQLPAPGIYAGWYVGPRGTAHAAAVALGRRPTFSPASDRLLLEAYLLDFEGDLYGEAAAVRFVERLRDEERFDSVEELVAQMGRDVEATRAVLRRRQ
jgi:riboflavin kinase/FMN adenylyltransferase